MQLRLGRISYLNVAPYFHHLLDEGFSGEIVKGVPSELNRLLDEGRVDVCPSSSFEYGLHADKYLILKGHSISSFGPVHSVLLFTRSQLNLLGDEEICITGESATSVNLLKVLLQEFCGVSDVKCQVPKGAVEDALAGGESALLIGDRALAAARSCPVGVQMFDLGALWYHFTGLPFVFALWLLRRDAAMQYADEVVALERQLQSSRQKALADLQGLAKSYVGASGFDVAGLERYWRGIDYDLNAAHIEGLRLFFTLCEKYKLLDTVPELHFFAMEEALASA